MAAKLTHILNFKAKFHKEFELFSKKAYANNGGHFTIVSITKKSNLSMEDLIMYLSSGRSSIHHGFRAIVRGCACRFWVANCSCTFTP